MTAAFRSALTRRLLGLAAGLAILAPPQAAWALTGNCRTLLYFPAVLNELPAGGGGPVAARQGCATLTNVDFNGDGYEDLAIGVPGESIAGVAGAGAVNILHGSALGLVPPTPNVWHLGSPDIDGTPSTGDGFGQAVAVGDFNRDGYSDLAVGMPGRPISALADAGEVLVLYGSPTGLSSTGEQTWSQASTDMNGLEEANDEFGSTLTTGDFNGDGYADLAIGSVGESVAEGGTDYAGAGAVNVLYGSAAGLTATGNEIWSRATDQVEGVAFTNDEFGDALAAGDFNGDGIADLAISAPGHDLAAIFNTGAIHVLYGTPSGLTATGSQLWSQDTAAVNGVPETNDRTGEALAAADFNGDGRDDLAIGIPYEDVNLPPSQADAGAILLLYGSDAGLATAGNKAWYASLDGLDGFAEAGDRFGYSLAAGDFDQNGLADLAIGVPYEDTALSDVGEVIVMYGTPTGLNSAKDNLWDQDNVPGLTAQIEDNYGLAVAVGDFDGTGDADLAIGMPGQAIFGLDNAGAINTLYGSVDGLTSTGNQLWHQEVANVSGDSSVDDRFGWALR